MGGQSWGSPSLLEPTCWSTPGVPSLPRRGQGGSGQGSQHPAMWLVPPHRTRGAWPPACALPPPATVLPPCLPGCRSFGEQKRGQEGAEGVRGRQGSLGAAAGGGGRRRGAQFGCCRAPGKGFTLEMGPNPNQGTSPLRGSMGGDTGPPAATSAATSAARGSGRGSWDWYRMGRVPGSGRGAQGSLHSQ